MDSDVTAIVSINALSDDKIRLDVGAVLDGSILERRDEEVMVSGGAVLQRSSTSGRLLPRSSLMLRSQRCARKGLEAL
ncbi:hypothetical protein E2562_018653 [Oryza meyeriana var. granulata]|uniref:Uncharacterized protein n=1 Tax=Oryza meyeriana var. granulata TaxID=110450 RepID=A0A6G1BY44_9ORYZ|nr:hypothetical protein E2562_018653 [Oryza meyeriana var. granulata]